MKSTKIAYWIFTILMVFFMLSSAIPSFIKNPQGEAMMQHLGYPYAILKFLAVAKILGSIVIFLPGFSRLKEWVYAGFTFDLLGAIFAGLSAGDSLLMWWPVIVGVGLIFGSYICYHKLRKLKGEEK